MAVDCEENFLRLQCSDASNAPGFSRYAGVIVDESLLPLSLRNSMSRSSTG